MAILHWVISQLGRLLFKIIYAKPSSSARYYIMPLVMGGLAIAPLLSIVGFTDDAIMSSVLVLIASIITALMLHQHHLRVARFLSYQRKKSQTEHDSFCRQVFPLWVKQINTSRQIGDKAVAELAALFGEIVSRLGTMLNTSSNNARIGQNGESGIIGVIENSQSDFQTVFTDLKLALQAANDSKALILAEVNKYSSSMKESAANAQKMAMQSQIISLNAEIEAARAGKAGAAFASVVSEMRELSSQTAETSRLMAKKVKSIDAVMDKFHEEEKQMCEIETQHVSRAETMFKDIVVRFRKGAVNLEESIEEMEHESRHVKNDISNALVELQFQDRLSQVLHHVADNINTANEVSSTGIKSLNADNLLNEMKNNFSVDEEHDNMSGEHVAVNKPSLLTFFGN